MRSPDKKTILLRKQRTEKIVAKLKKLFPNAKIALQYSDPLQLLIAVMLSAQTTDKQVNKVTPNLFKKYQTLDDYVNSDIKEFEKDIHSTGFYHNKAKHILASVKIIKKKFDGEVPNTMEGLLSLPGVARKTANVVLGNLYGKVEGIAVDTHVRRLSKVLGLTDETDPVKIEKDLMAILPKKEWFDFTYRIIEYGRNYCIAKTHDHAHCPLSEFHVKA